MPKDLVESAFDQLHTLVPSASVTVVVNGASVDGILDTTRGAQNLVETGQRGDESGRVRFKDEDCSASSISLGQSIAVNGSDAFVTSVSVDPLGAVVTVEYTKQKPVTGIADPVL